jgi:hypothetical protein
MLLGTRQERIIGVFTHVITMNVWGHPCMYIANSMQLEVLVSSHKADAALSTFQYNFQRRGNRPKGMFFMRVGSGTYKKSSTKTTTSDSSNHVSNSQAHIHIQTSPSPSNSTSAVPALHISPTPCTTLPTFPSTGLRITVSIFILSITTNGWFFTTSSPALTSTLKTLQGIGARTLFAASFVPSALACQAGWASAKLYCRPCWKRVRFGEVGSRIRVVAARVWG